MDLIQFVQGFINIFQVGGEWFWALVSGMIPYIIVLMTAVNAFIALIGHERVEKFGEWASKPGWIFMPIRYVVLPFIAVFVFTNPMAYTMGRFLPEKMKPAFYDSAVSYVHPPLGIFPHINPGELFVWLGIAAGVQQGYGDAAMADLAIRYLLIGLVVILIRGIVTERLTLVFIKKAAE
jgi:glucitol/sorbitol PTS system EIIC component